eukprot:m.172008 g.172008  ORF g.172008 m.172008 type:complete len:469 (-) comp14568_c0_seq2:219-1625(-)
MEDQLGVIDAPLQHAEEQLDWSQCRIGGAPAWPGSLAPPTEMQQCDACKAWMGLTVQLYCPTSGRSNVHRVLYILTCTNDTCIALSEPPKQESRWKLLCATVIPEQKKGTEEVGGKDDAVQSQPSATASASTAVAMVDDWGTGDDSEWGVSAGDEWGASTGDEWGAKDDAGTSDGASDEWGVGETTLAARIDMTSTSRSTSRSTARAKGASVFEFSELDKLLEQESKAVKTQVQERSKAKSKAAKAKAKAQAGHDWDQLLSQSMLADENMQVFKPSYIAFVSEREVSKQATAPDQAALRLEKQFLADGGVIRQATKEDLAGLGVSSVQQETDEDDEVFRMDPSFFQFRERISNCPEQIMRYSDLVNQLPLHISSFLDAPPLHYKKCSVCSSPCSYELQLLPSFHSVLRPTETNKGGLFSFGTVIGYTCRSCTTDVQPQPGRRVVYQLQHILVTPDPDDLSHQPRAQST